MDLEKIVECAMKLEMTTEERKTWVDLQDKKAREERVQRRSHEKEVQELINADKEKEELRRQNEEEREKEKRQFELEKIKLETERLKQEVAMAATRDKLSEEEKQQKEEQRKFEADQKRKDRELAVQIEKNKNEAMLKAKQMEIESKAELEHQRRHDTKEIPKHKKYQHVIKCFTKDDSFPAWLKNMERCLIEDNIPEDDWAFILKKSLSGEPQRLIENIGERYISDYPYLRDKLMSHFKCDAEGRRLQFHGLAPKSNQTFFDYLTEVEATLDHWLEAEAVEKSYERFHQMLIKDKILTSIPVAMARFLKEQRITTIKDLEEKGTAYFNANRDVFSLCNQPALDIGAAATWSKDKKHKQSSGSWGKYSSSKKDNSSASKDSKCKYCDRVHSRKSLCDSSPEGKSYLEKHIQYAADKRKQCALEGACYCCKLIGHSAKVCKCKQKKYYSNAAETLDEPKQKLTTKYMRKYMHSLGLETDTDEDNESSSSAEDEWQVNAVEIDRSDQEQGCIECRMFHEYGLLNCGHLFPYVDVPVNAVKVTEGTLKLYPGIVNGARVNLIRDTGSMLVGIHKDLVSEKDYTGEYVSCRTFGGTKETYPLAWIDIDSAFLKDRIIAAVVTNPCASVILGNVNNIKECSNEQIQEWIQEQNWVDTDIRSTDQPKKIETQLQDNTVQIVMPVKQTVIKEVQFTQSQQKDEAKSKGVEMIKLRCEKGKYNLMKGLVTKLYSKGTSLLRFLLIFMTGLLLRVVQNVRTYMDTEVINNDNCEQHIQSLRRLFQRIERANFNMKSTNVDVDDTEINFLQDISKATVITDSKPRTIMTSKLPKNSRLTRWSLILQNYLFEVSHIKGVKNCLPDILSRLWTQITFRNLSNKILNTNTQLVRRNKTVDLPRENM
ncbi:hypothetical protein BsWGS_11854 [Bradybaena similaris]